MISSNQKIGAGVHSQPVIVQGEPNPNVLCR
jgi:hypothetical protein